MRRTDKVIYRTIISVGLALCALWALPAAQAQNTVIIGELSYFDQQYMTQQRAIMEDLAARNFGHRFNGNKDNDLTLLQSLLDKRLVQQDQTRELQAMGVIMGDLLAAELDMHWVVYEDWRGRSRALRYRESDEYLFPVTMISRRREVDNQTPVTDIYQKAYDIMSASKPPLPFQ
jgi:hypothetical protein